MKGRIPVYFELEITSINPSQLEEIRAYFENLEGPLILNLHKLSKDEAISFTAELKELLNIRSNIDLLPFPIYFLSALEFKISPFLVFRDYHELPNFYTLSNKRMGSREINYLKNNRIVTENIKNLDISTKYNKHLSHLSKNKLINDLIEENSFYEEILNRMP
ncbi:hypothetical protein N9O57_00715 [bacterium]|nr:hypothetical protein [bacterium]